MMADDSSLARLLKLETFDGVQAAPPLQKTAAAHGKKKKLAYLR
jgi:hypothetical protein